MALQMCTLLDTMSTETGERNAQAAHRTALETVIEDTEAELAKLQRSKVASMIRLYQGKQSAPPLPASTPVPYDHLHSSGILPRSVERSRRWVDICPRHTHLGAFAQEVDWPCHPGMESPQHDSPKIGARHSPQSQKKLDNPLIPASTAADSFSEVGHLPHT